jgi:hypothetical protein
MTPKEKAIELLDKMSSRTYQYQEYAGARYTTHEVGDEAGKQCALIAADEIIKLLYNDYYDINNGLYEYWEDVQNEIKKL